VRTHTVATAAVVVLTGVVSLAGCSSGSSVSSARHSADATTSAASSTALTVGMGAGVYTAPLSTSYFKDAGLTVTPQNVTSGAVAIPLLLNGQLQFSEADSVGALTAISKGVPLVIVGAVTSGGATPATDNTGVLVKPGGPVTSAAALSGRTVAVNAIGGSAQLSAEAAIDKLGGNSHEVKFVELPPASMVSAVQNGTVAAAVTSAIDGQAAGLRVLFSPLAAGMPSAPLIVWITSQAYAASHPAIVAKFAKATAQADTYLAAHPDIVRQITVSTSTIKVSPALAQKLVLAQFLPATVQKAALQTVIDVMEKYKVISAPINLDKVLVSS
jgi:NitT/TauT family transport system substrate-binding protein